MTSTGYRLIWGNSAPAPFESGWAIFAKLFLLNELGLKQITSLISTQKRSITENRSLNFRNSSWIDFRNFSMALGVDESRLRSAFLDQLGLPMPEDCFLWSNVRGIKHCSECLSHGYHCVFFELSFIDTCPWHGKLLNEPCIGCLEAVLNKRFTKREEMDEAQLTGEHPSEVWNEWRSKCGHIHLSADKINRSIQFSLLEQKIIAEYCLELLSWCKAVCRNSGIADFIFRYEHQDIEKKSLSKFFNAAENIAGPCPWPIRNLQRSTVRSQLWLQGRTENNLDVVAPRKTEWDKVYRSVRRHLFRRYVRQHRSCWNELSNYSCMDVLRMDCDTVCPVSLAYATWRLSREQFINTEIFKDGTLKNHPIHILRGDSLGIPNSVRMFAYFIYAQFFYIWDEILQLVQKREFSIHLKRETFKYDFAVIHMPHQRNATHESLDAFAIIIPDFCFLEKQSFLYCCGNLKTPGWMLYPGLIGDWHAYVNYENNFGNGVIFRLRKLSFRKRSSYLNMYVG